MCRRYILHTTGDDAGTRAALRALPILKDAGITAKIIRMEPYKDPDEFIKNLGQEAFQERIDRAAVQLVPRELAQKYSLIPCGCRAGS